VEDGAVRRLFTREYLMQSEWYAERLRAKQRRDVALWTRHLNALQRFQAGGDSLGRGGVEQRLAEARAHLGRVSAANYVKELEGGLGADPFGGA
jgi:phosphoenolpyruvate carboxykinase (diphosphate)